jgi:CheY-like chemotaxis protein
MKKAVNLFIIDDDIDDIDFFKKAVSEIDPGIECHSAFDAKEALEKLQVTSTIPDMIFLDLNMPGTSGRQCLWELKRNEKLRNIPVIIFTTSSLQKDKEETKQMGAMHFLTKPSTFTDTRAALADIILNIK